MTGDKDKILRNLFLTLEALMKISSTVKHPELRHMIKYNFKKLYKYGEQLEDVYRKAIISMPVLVEGEDNEEVYEEDSGNLYEAITLFCDLDDFNTKIAMDFMSKLKNSQNES